MPNFRPFAMERWQSVWENRVDYNLSESGVHPLTLRQLLDMHGDAALGDTLLGYGQSNGSDALRAAIAGLYPGATEANVVVTNGSAEANFIALWALLEPGDEVAVITPTYMQAPGLATAFGATVRPIPMREADGWQPDPADIAAAVGPRTRVIVVTNPGNPTGAVLGETAIGGVLEAAARTGAWILADEVYSGAELDGRETPSLFGRHDRVIATGSLSKAYGLPGLRLGWAVTDPTTAERLWARSDYTTIAPGALSDELALVALDRTVRPRLLQRTRSIIRTGLDVLEGWLAAQRHEGRPIFTWRSPDAGAILFARYDLPIGSEALADRLRTDHGVLIVPGAHFDMDSHLRFGFGLDPDELEAALGRMAAMLAEIAPVPAVGAH